MNYQNLKFAQIGILIGVSISSSSMVTLPVVVALALLNSDRYYLTTIFSIICSIIPFMEEIVSFKVLYLLPLVCIGLLSYAERRQLWEKGLSSEQKLTIFLMLFGLTTLNGQHISARVQLLFFFAMLIFKVMHFTQTVIFLTKAFRVILSIEALMVSAIVWRIVPWGQEEVTNQSWWFIASFPMAILCTSLLLDDEDIKSDSESLLTESKSMDIELEDFSKREIQQRESEERNQVRQVLKNEEDNEESQRNNASAQQEQEESLNLFLVIPFCLLQQGWLEIPIYIYVFALQWGASRRWLLVIVLLAVGFITANCQVQINIDIFLRILAVLLVAKNMQGGSEVGQILKIIWLRSSFALVLTVLFWFSLLTVNIFHLLFICIILLFITKGAGQSQIHSFRHRNWKYLLGLFNVFLVMRLMYLLVLKNGITHEKWKDFLELSGISYSYVVNDRLFNAIPLLINAIMGLQYFTYNSKIYSKHSQSVLFQNYRAYLAILIDILTVIYYKLLPWVSYFAIISLLIVLQPSLGAFILLTQILITLGAHILSRNEPSSYKRLLVLWLCYSRLTYLQIVLRYVFEFAKFNLLSFTKNLPFLKILQQYEQILGLAIRDQQTVYFKTVTKFQLMISLDLMAIFIAFLVTEYYSLLLKYSQLPPHEQWGFQQHKVDDVYRHYIDFKLTSWLQDKKIYKIILIFCTYFIELYFPILGLFCCSSASILSFIYLLLVLRYFLALNFQYYRTHIRSGFGMIVLNIVLNWSKQKPSLEAHDLNSHLKVVGHQMDSCKVNEHKKLRIFFVLVTVVAVLLTYISTTLQITQLYDLIGIETALHIRWWLLVGGCSLEYGFMGHFSKIMLFVLVLQMKCCWFVNKFYVTARNYPPEQEEDVIIKDVLTGQELFEDYEEVRSNYDELEGREIQSSILGESQSENKQISEMRVSLLLGILKLLERGFVMVLVFISIVLGSHPFGIIYLLCAILLNYLGSVSIKVLSRILSILMVLEYLLILSNYSNPIFYPELTPVYGKFQERTLLSWLFELPEDWQWYLTFGKGKIELSMLTISWILLACYQLYFVALRKTWLKILALADAQMKLGIIGKRMFEHFRQVYEYCLTYSPLVIMLLCLFIYLLDYTTTNMLLTALTVGFIFVSFLIRDYRESRHFWRTYFVVLQLLIVCFMLIYSLLQLPMLSSFCNRLLCAPQELHTQIYKAVLLLILQIGLDLTSSYHFDRALRQFQRSKHIIQLQKLAIAYHHNDKKILQIFKQIRKEKELLQTVDQVQQFLKGYKENPQLEFNGKGQNYETKQTWYNIIIQSLPSLIDEHLLLDEHKAKLIIQEENAVWMTLKDIREVNTAAINQLYMDEYGELQGDQLKRQLQGTLMNFNQRTPIQKRISSHKDIEYDGNQIDEEEYYSRKSYLGEGLPMESYEVMSNMRKTIKNEEQKEQLIYLLLVESVLSNWHYLTYLFLLLLHINNQGLLTLPIPAVVFCFGLVSSYQAGKQVWRCLLLLVLLPLLFKFIINVQLVQPSQELIFLLIGDNMSSVLLEYICIVLIICQCVILKMIGHFNESTEEIECMKMALVRNILNHNRPQETQDLFKLLRQSNKIPLSFGDMLFGKAECKPGYDYSTLLTTLQLTVLIWVFLFYDRMAIRQQITFYQMIEYNQFSSGMVALTLCQLVFLLTQRFIAIVDLRSNSNRWEIGLLLKYILLICNFLLVEIVILIYFPLSSGQFAGNGYVTTLLVMNMLGLLVQSLQIKAGLDQSSRGFMDRYTWYNGFIYIGYRAVPFLFEFKAFSDWTFTRTSLRIFDWIRLEEIFGRLYVAKCNALFLAGKQLGSKIEWWKKLLMGYPLLLSIILLLFGPLVLFSNLNPLASRNDVIAGYLEVVLRINKTNEYPLYTNSHITDIHRLNASEAEQELLKLYDIDLQTVQQLRLEEFSDQYWQISEGSYYKLLSQPQESFYQLIVRAKFDRNQTGISSLYVLSTYQMENERVPQFKEVLLGRSQFCAENFLPTFLRLDNNNGLHELGQVKQVACLRCTAGVRASKQYWVLDGGLRLKMASDKYTKAIFGYSVMSFYISIILVIANYFKFLFQGTVNTIITSDIPHPDPALALCNAIFRARRQNDLIKEQMLFWGLIDLLRSPDTLKALTGNYLQARLDTLQGDDQFKQD